MGSNCLKRKYLGQVFRVSISQNACILQNNEMFSQCIDNISPVTDLMEEFDSLILDSEKYGPNQHSGCLFYK